MNSFLGRDLGLNPFRVHQFILRGEGNAGERLPVLINRATGFPINAVLEYALSQRRSKLALSALASELRILGLVHWWAAANMPQVDIPQRLLSGQGLAQHELEMGLWQALRENYRAGTGKASIVGPNVLRQRLVVARAYFDWLMTGAISRASMAKDRPKVLALEVTRAGMSRTLEKLLPKKRKAPEILGLNAEQLALLIDAVQVDSPANPWRSSPLALRARNELIVELGLAFGPRRGELLKARVGDADLNGPHPVLWLRRRPDDKQDPRIDEPAVKTQERALPLSDQLADRLETFILKHRRNFKGSRKTPFLLLSWRDERPLSKRGFNALFQTLQSVVPGIYPHLLRHTANEGLVTRATELGVDEKTLSRHARYLSGWLTDNLDVYARRAIQDQVRRASLSYQKALFEKVNG